MRSFFKIFFASLLALFIFCLLMFFIVIGFVSTLASKEKEEVAAKSVLMLDLGKHYSEFSVPDPMSVVSNEEETPSLYELTRLIEHAKNDNNISGIYMLADGNANGPAASEEIRTALLDFKKSKKFVIAYGDMVSQQAYFVASAANRIYLNPAGGMEWMGFSVTLPFLKGTLEKLDVQPQIFYAGKFKSATEIFRTDKMTPENRLQTTAWLNSLYNHFLMQVSAARGVDTATLHQLANAASVQTPQDAVKARLVDAAKYDDEVKAEIKTKLKLASTDKLHLLSVAKYSDAVNIRKTGTEKIAIIYAEGNIVDGEGSTDNIGGERFRALIRKARLDKNVKAIVLRVNSGGGSALASEVIWRELQMAKTENRKPVVVSFGDVAASGGYYIACGADSIFAHPNTITGSIGVFGMLPNMQGFFKNKLGVTFDGVKTAPYADAISVVKPMDEKEKQLMQVSIDRIYMMFKQRVSAGRKKDVNQIDSIAQGRVWSGRDALGIGLVDRLGDMNDAIACAARMAKVSKYGIKEYPEKRSWINTLLDRKKAEPSAMIREQVGAENYELFLQLKSIRELSGSVQARLPYEIIIR